MTGKANHGAAPAPAAPALETDPIFRLYQRAQRCLG